MVRAYWLRIVICGLVGLILGFIVAQITPKQYEGVVQVMMPPSDQLGSRAESSADQSVIDLINFSQPRNVTTQVEALTSLGVIATAAQNVAVRYNQDPGLGSEFYPPDLQDRISVTAATQSDVVTLRVRASDPSIARDIAGEMYLAWNEQSSEAATEFANRAVESLKTQIQKIDDQVNEIDRATEAARKELNSPNIEVQITQNLAQIKELEASVMVATQEAAAAAARAGQLQSEIAKLQPMQRAGTTYAKDPTYQALDAQLLGALADRAQLLERYYEDHESVKGVDRRIAEIRAQMKGYKATSEASNVEQPNPSRLALQQELALTNAQIRSAQDRIRVATGQLDAKRAEAAKLPGLQTRLTGLARNQIVLERLQASYRDRLASLEAAGRGRMNTSSLITPAQASARPVVPNTNLNISLGFILGIAAGFLWSLSSEARRNPIRSLGQLNRLALQPSYRVIPELRVPMRGLSRPPADVFDAMLVNFIRSEKKGYRIGILGVGKGAGATTTAMNVAISAARGGYSVLYVEIDPGNNALTKLTPAVGDVKSPGANISIFNASLGESTSGGTIGLPAELEAAMLGKDLVVFDFAPVKVSGDAFLIANQLDEMVLLVRANVTKSVDFLQAQQALIDSGCPLVTVTLSRVVDQMDDIAALEQQAELRTAPTEA